MCKEIRSVRLVPALVRTQSLLGVHLTSHRAAQSFSCEPLLKGLQPLSVGTTYVSKDLQIWMSLVFKTLQPKQDIIQTKMQCST